MKKVTVALLISSAIFTAPSFADVLYGTIYGTGQGSSPGGRDSYWNIVALPAKWTNAPASLPYAAYVPTGVHEAFIGGNNPQSGVVFGSVTNYWIAPQSSADSLLEPDHYNWIVAQTFVVPTNGLYYFQFSGAGDNELDFYINGSITNYQGDTNRPTITGGTQIGSRAGGYSYLTTFNGQVNLTAGTNTAYMVLWDYGGSTGALIQQSLFSDAPIAGVPEPGTWAAAALLVGTAVYARWRRRAKVA